jgi:hypothetical protein
MTLADRMVAAILAHGPMPECHLATTVGARKADVSAELECNPAFVHNGLKARASRWDVRASAGDSQSVCWNGSEADAAVTFPVDYDVAEEALITLVRQGRECPEGALLRVVCAVNGAVP